MGGEDWQMLDTLVSSGTLDNKAEILAIIRDTTLTADQREDSIKAKYPSDYATMLAQYYPKLRRTYYQIDFTIRNYDDLDDIHRVYLTHPEYLSLQELYRLLGYYTKYSKDYYLVYIIGAKYFRHSRLANINGGAAALVLGDYANARLFLHRVRHLPLGLYNLGVLACYENDLVLALKYFRELRAMPEASDLSDNLNYIIPRLEKTLEEQEAIKREKEKLANAKEEGGHQFVDLGLPSGTVWATCNVGAKNYNDPGDFFMWGDVISIDAKAKKPVKEWCPVHKKEFSVLREDNRYIDDDNTLLKKFDAASKNWGGLWEMPTPDQVSELIQYTTKKYVEDEKGHGIWVTSKINGNSIYFPMVGHKESYGSGINRYISNERKDQGYYWTSSPYPKETFSQCLILGYISGSYTATMAVAGMDRNVGTPIRPVFNKNNLPQPKAVELEIEKSLPVNEGNGSSESGNSGIAEHEAIDLGLPSGLKWAAYNVGATKPTERGTIYSWGMTEPVSGYFDTQSHTYYKTNEWLASHGYLTPNGELSPEYDAATQNWGKEWHTPSTKDYQELVENTIIDYEEIDGVPLMKLTSKINGKSIYFIGGGIVYDGRALFDKSGYYWTTTPQKTWGAYAANFTIDKSDIRMGEDVIRPYNELRFLGLQVRAVRK